MNTIFSKNLFRGFLFTVMLTTAGLTAMAMHDPPACTANATTLAQLKDARRATAPYHSIRAAEAAGYVDINLPVPHMGEHWVNGSLVDGVFEADKPEALVYADLGNGQLRLVAVEYLAPYDPAGPPAGFAGTCDSWAVFPSPENPVFWTLHAWVWEPNIAGTFAKFNPMVP